MQTIKLREEFIRLGQALKASGLCDTGSEAKIAVQSGQVKVNGETETRRGRKLTGSEVIEFEGQQVLIEGMHED